MLQIACGSPNVFSGQTLYHPDEAAIISGLDGVRKDDDKLEGDLGVYGRAN